LISPDGSNWTVVVSGQDHFDLWGVAYGNGFFVAVGSAGNILTSSDANSWSRVTLSPAAYFRSVAYGNGVWVASGARLLTSLSYPVLFHSTDGVSWSESTIPTDRPYFTLDRAAFVNGVFIVVSSRAGQDGGGMIFSSVDGVHWQQRHSPTMNDLTGVAANESSIVLAGPAGFILQSGDMRPRLRFERCCFNDTGVHQLTLSGVSNCVYQTELSADLVHWTARWTNRVTGPEALVFQSGASFPQRFYRSQLVQPVTP
jgi:hypothetical protein